MAGSADWTTPRDWVFEETVTDAQFNEQIRDNITFLRELPYFRRAAATAPGNTTSTTFVSMAAGLDLNITTQGGRLLVGATLNAVLVGGTPKNAEFRIIDDSANVYAQAMIDFQSNGVDHVISMVGLGPALTAGVNNIEIQWKVQSGGTLSINSSAITSFWAIEIRA